MTPTFVPLQEDPSLGDRISTTVEQAIVDALSILSELLIALAILLVGYWVAGKAQTVVTRLGRRANLDSKISNTPLSVLFGDGQGAAAAAFGVIVRYYIILVAAFAALEYIGFDVVTRWLEDAVSYVPVFVGGLIILLVGFYVADYAAELVRRSATAQASGLPQVFGDVTKAVLYFVVVVIGLDTIGVSVGILYTLGETFALAAGVAFALAVGIAFGWGAKDYVAENVGEWHDEAAEEASLPEQTDTE